MIVLFMKIGADIAECALVMNFLVLGPIAYFTLAKKFDPVFKDIAYAEWIPTLIGTKWFLRSGMYCLFVSPYRKLRWAYCKKALGDYDFKGNCNAFELVIANLFVITYVIYALLGTAVMLLNTISPHVFPLP